MDSARRPHRSIVIIRVFLAATMIIHGVARAAAHGIEPFGGFLAAKGFPLGYYLATAITIFEILGGIVLAAGYFVPVISLIFVLQLIVGVVLVHAENGWFVVGLGRNGMEYSALLIVSFLAVADAHFGKSKN